MNLSSQESPKNRRQENCNRYLKDYHFENIGGEIRRAVERGLLSARGSVQWEKGVA
jgi:hypothetical protein